MSGFSSLVPSEILITNFVVVAPNLATLARANIIGIAYFVEEMTGDPV